MAGRAILVADDDRARREGVAEALVLDGYRVVVAPGGPGALRRFRELRPDLVVLGVGPSEARAVELRQAVRAEGTVPVLAIVESAPGVDAALGPPIGADDVLARPFDPGELGARVAALLRGSDEAIAADEAVGRVRLGRVQVDLAGRRLIQEDRSVPLKPRAFELLAFLVGHAGQVFSRRQLLEGAWGPGYAGDARTVDVHVHWLRQRIEEDPGRPEILQTVRGVGYVLRRPG